MRPVFEYYIPFYGILMGSADFLRPKNDWVCTKKILVFCCFSPKYKLPLHNVTSISQVLRSLVWAVVRTAEKQRLISIRYISNQTYIMSTDVYVLLANINFKVLFNQSRRFHSLHHISLCIPLFNTVWCIWPLSTLVSTTEYFWNKY